MKQSWRVKKVIPIVRFRTLAFMLTMGLAVSPLTGCGSGSAGNYLNKIFGFQSSSDLDFDEDVPQTLASQAQELMDADNYKDAAVLWQQLKDQYPYSRYALLGELKLGDSLFVQEKYIEALGAYEDFERLHPENEAAVYAIYQQGMCYYLRMNSIDHDQTATIQTIQTMTRLVETYPGNKYAIMAQTRITEAQNNLAGHEFYVGDFYFNRKDYAAAMHRYMGLIQYYPDSGYHQKALNRIAEYRQLVADGVVEDSVNQRDNSFDSPFLSSPNNTGDTVAPGIF